MVPECNAGQVAETGGDGADRDEALNGLTITRDCGNPYRLCCRLYGIDPEASPGAVFVVDQLGIFRMTRQRNYLIRWSGVELSFAPPR